MSVIYTKQVQVVSAGAAASALVEDYAALRAADNPTSGGILTAAGRLDANDGGQGPFRWDPSITGPQALLVTTPGTNYDMWAVDEWTLTNADDALIPADVTVVVFAISGSIRGGRITVAGSTVTADITGISVPTKARAKLYLVGNPANNDTITLNGTVWTFTTGASGSTNTQIKGSATLTATELASNLNGSADAEVSKLTWSSSGAVLDGSFDTVGTGGNSYTLASNSPTAKLAWMHSTCKGGSTDARFSLLMGDGGTVIERTGIAAGRWVREGRFDGFHHDPRWYGAKFDGAFTDDTAAHNLTLARIHTVGGLLVVSGGYTKHTSTLYVHGVGRGIKGRSGAKLTYAPGAATSPAVVVSAGADLLQDGVFTAAMATAEAGNSAYANIKIMGGVQSALAVASRYQWSNLLSSSVGIWIYMQDNCMEAADIKVDNINSNLYGIVVETYHSCAGNSAWFTGNNVWVGNFQPASARANARAWLIKQTGAANAIGGSTGNDDNIKSNIRFEVIQNVLASGAYMGEMRAGSVNNISIKHQESVTNPQILINPTDGVVTNNTFVLEDDELYTSDLLALPASGQVFRWDGNISQLGTGRNDHRTRRFKFDIARLACSYGSTATFAGAQVFIPGVSACTNPESPRAYLDGRITARGVMGSGSYDGLTFTLDVRRVKHWTIRPNPVDDGETFRLAIKLYSPAGGTALTFADLAAGLVYCSCPGPSVTGNQFTTGAERTQRDTSVSFGSGVGFAMVRIRCATQSATKARHLPYSVEFIAHDSSGAVGGETLVWPSIAAPTAEYVAAGGYIPTKLPLGPGSITLGRRYSSTEPYMGLFAAGEYIWNIADTGASGQTRGWLCTTAGAKALPWAATTLVQKYDMCNNDTGKIYECITGGGNTAGSGGPTGTAADITDNVVHWAYTGLATAVFTADVRP